jgi:hypothetical protein
MIQFNDSKFFVIERSASDAVARCNMAAYSEEWAQARFDESSIKYVSTNCPSDPMKSSVRPLILDNPRASLTEGKRGDVTWAQFGELLVNERVIEILKRSNITGFMAKPVQMAEGDKMYWITATGWAGMAAKKSRIYRAEYHEDCGYVHYKVRGHPDELIDSSTWDGSDIFMVWPMPLFHFATKRVAEILTSNNVTGLVCVHELCALRASDGFGPGRLSDYMDANLARERGRIAGIAEV